MTLFESLKQFPKIDLHIDYFGSITKDTIYELTKTRDSKDSLDELLEFDSLTNYNNSKELVKKILNNYDNIKIATNNLLIKLQNDNLLYGEIFINLDSFMVNLDKNVIIKMILDLIKEKNMNINIVLEVESNITKDNLYDDLNILYEYYNKGINGIYFKKNKLDNLDTFKSLFDRFNKDGINYIILMDSKVNSQNKDIYYNASRIIYNLNEMPDEILKENIIKNNIILEEAISYQNYFNVYDDIKNHIIYDLYKENIMISFVTIDMTSSDTDLLNEYCKVFNVFPFSLHDLVVINLNILNNINVSLELKNNLISEFRTKANELL